MKQKLKFWLTTMALLVVFGANAQSRFGLKAGLNFASMNVNDYNPGGLSEKQKGFLAGFVIDSDLSEQFTFQTGLLYTSKGMKSPDGKEKLITYSFEMPLNGVLHAPLGFGDFLIIAGPYMALGVTGNIENGTTPERGMRNTIFDSSLRRFDYGLNLGTGLEVRRFQFCINYGIGLRNLAMYDVKNQSIKNRVMSLSMICFLD